MPQKRVLRISCCAKCTNMNLKPHNNKTSIGKHEKEAKKKKRHWQEEWTRVQKLLNEPWRIFVSSEDFLCLHAVTFSHVQLWGVKVKLIVIYEVKKANFIAILSFTGRKMTERLVKKGWKLLSERKTHLVTLISSLSLVALRTDRQNCPRPCTDTTIFMFRYNEKNFSLYKFEARFFPSKALCAVICILSVRLSDTMKSQLLG